jgi:hypothetical protein
MQLTIGILNVGLSHDIRLSDGQLMPNANLIAKNLRNSSLSISTQFGILVSLAKPFVLRTN